MHICNMPNDIFAAQPAAEELLGSKCSIHCDPVSSVHVAFTSPAPPLVYQAPPLGALCVTCTKGPHQGVSTRLCSDVKGGGFTTKGLVD